MSIRSKYSLINFVVWVIVLIVLTITFDSSDYRSLDKIIGAASLFIGFSVSILVLIKSRLEPQDERILSISNRSTAIAMILTLLYVFSLCIILSEIYPQTISSSWFWYLGYSMICVANIASSILYFIIEKTGNSYEG